MAFFRKLKDRLFKSSSKIEEGVDAIIDEGADSAPAEPAEAAPAELPAPETREARPGPGT